MATLSLSFTIPDNKIARVKDDFCAHHGYNADTDGTQNSFIKKKVGQFIKDSVKAHRANADAEAARQTSIADTDSITLS